MSSTKPEFDALMVDWLYGELDAAEAASFEEHLARHPEARAEAEAYKRTRAAFQDLGEAEPTHSLSAILMHEAALAVTPKETLWSRFAALFQPILLHPAASAMATVVLLCGVAGALYLKDGAKLAEPVASSTAPAPADRSSLEAARDPAPQPALPAADLAAQEEMAAGYRDDSNFDKDGFAVDLVGDERQQAITGARQAARSETIREAEAKPEGAAIVDSKSRKKSKEDRGGTAGGLVADKVDAEPTTSATGALSLRKGPAGEFKSAPADTATNERANGKAEAWEKTQKQNLQLAAQSKRCKEVGRIANDILDKNSIYYKEEVEQSKGAEDCRYFIASETQRRAKSRARRAAARAKAKQGDSVPKKALAAPREADFESTEAN